MNEQVTHKLPFDLKSIFQIQSADAFEDLALKIFQFQYDNNTVYRQYVDLLGKDISGIKSIKEIPFLPISFFKHHEIKSSTAPTSIIFKSSGTTGQTRSTHHLVDPTIYQLSFIKGFEQFYGAIDDYLILGLLPNYLENENSSLIYMFDHLMQLSRDKESGFFLNDIDRLLEVINRRKNDKKILLIGVSYALLDLVENYQADLSGCIIMETGGMKGRRQEMTKEELHATLSKGLKVESIHSEYGMTELLSQAYSSGDGIFYTPPWMKILLRRYNDPFEIIEEGSGGINVIDLANIWSCSFIETEDLGKYNGDGFSVLGRLDNADLRGCNLLIQ
ncbi:acyl transferase [Paracrocinitomix mangrovi]|uniref:acyl transferase n=1 Tax=Paracrocinitomix mangrovi TaxID=2862509 RepID=UPI001C8E4436|nr:acyl transferase [Paracrocinitomix mangrovi]UKN01103.1 acyl transferase [Paracrocinitomix mangrovi]